MRLFVPLAHRTLYAGPWHLDRESRRLTVARAAAQSTAREPQAARAWQPIELGELRAVLALRPTAASGARCVGAASRPRRVRRRLARRRDGPPARVEGAVLRGKWR